jgi:hypothetical protein
MPHARTFLLFDDFIRPTNNWSSPVFTDTGFDELLGEFDQLAVHLIVDCISTGGEKLYGFLEHSCDGINWIPRTNQAVVFDSNSSHWAPYADFMLSLTTTTTFAQDVWSDAAYGVSSSGPMLARVRWRLFFGGTGSTAHVRLFATQRNIRRGSHNHQPGRHA